MKEVKTCDAKREEEDERMLRKVLREDERLWRAVKSSIGLEVLTSSASLIPGRTLSTQVCHSESILLLFLLWKQSVEKATRLSKFSPSVRAVIRSALRYSIQLILFLFLFIHRISVILIFLRSVKVIQDNMAWRLKSVYRLAV